MEKLYGVLMDNNSYLSIRKLNSVLNSVQNTAILKLLASTIQIHVYATFIIGVGVYGKRQL